MIKQTSDQVVPLTRDLAEDFATMRSVPGERKLTTARMNYLRSRFDDGVFHTPQWAIGTLGGIRYRVNGHTSSHMLLELNGRFPTDMKAHVMEFACDTMEDLAELFAQFDAKGSVRSFFDNLTVHGRIHPELNDISPTVMAKCVSGITFALGLNKKVTVDERARLVHSHQPFILWAAEFGRARHMDRAPVMAALYDTYHRHAAAATEFWRHVRDEDHPDVDDPSRVLARFLRDSLVLTGQQKTSRKWSPKAFYVKAIHAWNAYRRGTKTDLKFYNNDNVPSIA